MLTEILSTNNKIYIHQKKEIAELFGIETRNKYSIELANGQLAGFAAEEGNGISKFFGRQILGHWREFKILIINADKTPAYYAVHPFRIFFRRLEVFKSNNHRVGSIEQRFSLIYKKFDVLDANDNIIMNISGPLWKPWSFFIVKNSQSVALILKKWSGILKEAFTDIDSFSIEYTSSNLNTTERELIMAATILIDIVYFEKKASNKR